MSENSAKRPGGLPHNPDLRDLVQNKRHWSASSKPEGSKRGFRGWSERGYLPHRDEPGLTQFVTFRLADSFPESLRSEWGHLSKIEDGREKRKQLETYLDKGRGKCHLQSARIAQLVEDNFRRFSEGRYDLRAWAIMPNHVHVLFKVENVPMSEIVSAWKKNTGRLANKTLSRQGAFWAEDYFDIFMRDAEHEKKTVRYIESNPVKARLVLDPTEWPWSSARLRDEFGRLQL